MDQRSEGGHRGRTVHQNLASLPRIIPQSSNDLLRKSDIEPILWSFTHCDDKDRAPTVDGEVLVRHDGFGKRTRHLESPSEWYQCKTTKCRIRYKYLVLLE